MRLRRINQKGRCLLGISEGLRLEAYPDGNNIWTIGWGTTRVDGKPVTPGLKITREQAVEYFNADIDVFEREVCKLVKVPLTDNQFSAVISLCYNIGINAFRNSTLLTKLNRKDYTGAAKEFGRWVYSGGKIFPGLVERRKKEKQLFLTPDD